MPTGSRISRRPSWIVRPVAWIVSSALVSRRICSVATAAAAATRLPGVRPAVADLVGEQLHDLAPATERRGRVAVAHRLGVRGEVGRDAEELGGTAPREAEAGLDLVEDQQDPELLGQGAHLLVEARLGHDPLGVAEDRLDDDRGDLLAALLEEGAQAVDPVVAGRDHRVRDRARDPATPGQCRPERRRRRARTCRPGPTLISA